MGIQDRGAKVRRAAGAPGRSFQVIGRVLSRGSIRLRLLLGFGVLGILVAGVAVTGLYFVNASATTADSVINDQFPRTQVLSEAIEQVLLFEVEADQTGLSAAEGNAGRVPDHLKRMDAAAEQVDTALLVLKEGDAERGITADDDVECQQQITDLNAAWQELHDITHAWLEGEIAAAGMIISAEDHEEETGDAVIGEITLDTLEIKREKVTKLANELSEDFAADVAGAVDEVENTQRAASLASIIAAVVGLAFATVVGIGISSSILGPLQIAVDYAQAVADGDLTAQMEHHTTDEVGALTKSVEAMKVALVNRMDEMESVAAAVKAAAGDLAVAAEQIAATTNQLSVGAETQSAAAEETSASIEQMAASIEQVSSNAVVLGGSADETSATIGEMSASVGQIAENMDTLSSAVSETSASVEQMIASIEQVAQSASSVSESSDHAFAVADEGGRAVEKMADTTVIIAHSIQRAADVIRSLGDRTEQISKITEAIDDIAEQTNLLALNAAIEAARAGDQGKGFAVVAEAVRDLAGRAAASTKEISGLIASIRTDTEHAVKVTVEGLEQTVGSTELADNAREAINNVRSTFSAVADSMKQIERATSEQSSGGRQVLLAVEQMSSLHLQVDRAIQEQALASRRMVETVEDMGGRVNQVVTATGEQKRGGEQMVIAMESISAATRQNVSAISELAQSAQRLAQQSAQLNQLVAGFDTSQDAEESNPTAS